MIPLLIACLKVGCFTMGGAASILPVLAHEFVDRGQWLTQQEFLYGLVLCQGTPGPVITGMGIAGVKWGGIPGGILVITALMAPGIVWMVMLGRMHWHFRDHVLVQRFVNGIRPAIPGLLAALAVQLASSSAGSWRNLAIMAFALLLILRWRIPSSFLLLLGIAGSFLV